MDSNIREWRLTLGDIPVAFRGHLLAEVNWRPHSEDNEATHETQTNTY